MRVMRLLVAADRRSCLSQLTATLGLPASKLSKHLQVLIWAGLLVPERAGRWVWLSLSHDDPQLEYVQASLLAMPDSDGEFEADLARFIQVGSKVG
jgi:DNA-binding transcriptional ArsR family regulator